MPKLDSALAAGSSSCRDGARQQRLAATVAAARSTTRAPTATTKITQTSGSSRNALTGQDRGEHRLPDAGPDQQPAPVDVVGERAAVQPEDDDRHELDEADRADREVGAGQRVDLVGHRDVADHRAEVEDRAGEEQQPEVTGGAQRRGVHPQRAQASDHESGDVLTGYAARESDFSDDTGRMRMLVALLIALAGLRRRARTGRRRPRTRSSTSPRRRDSLRDLGRLGAVRAPWSSRSTGPGSATLLRLNGHYTLERLYADFDRLSSGKPGPARRIRRGATFYGGMAGGPAGASPMFATTLERRRLPGRRPGERPRGGVRGARRLRVRGGRPPRRPGTVS